MKPGKDGNINLEEGNIIGLIILNGNDNGMEVKRSNHLVKFITGKVVSIESLKGSMEYHLLYHKKSPIMDVIFISGI